MQDSRFRSTVSEAAIAILDRRAKRIGPKRLGTIKLQ
jgi:hypothetical protein